MWSSLLSCGLNISVQAVQIPHKPTGVSLLQRGSGRERSEGVPSLHQQSENAKNKKASSLLQEDPINPAEQPRTAAPGAALLTKRASSDPDSLHPTHDQQSGPSSFSAMQEKQKEGTGFFLTEKKKFFKDVQPEVNAVDCKDIYNKLKKGSKIGVLEKRKPVPDDKICWGDPTKTKFNKDKKCTNSYGGYFCQAVPGYICTASGFFYLYSLRDVDFGKADFGKYEWVWPDNGDKDPDTGNAWQSCCEITGSSKHSPASESAEEKESEPAPEEEKSEPAEDHDDEGPTPAPAKEKVTIRRDDPAPTPHHHKHSRCFNCGDDDEEKEGAKARKNSADEAAEDKADGDEYAAPAAAQDRARKVHEIFQAGSISQQHRVYG